MDRSLPADLDAERAVLGACLLERDGILVARTVVAFSDFYLEKHAWIYAAMLECVSRRVPPDVTTVSAELRRREQLDLIGGVAYLGTLTSEVPTAVHCEYYGKIVAECAARRRLIELGGRITAAGYDAQAELDALHTQLANELHLERTISVGREDWKHYTKDGVTRWREHYDVVPFTVADILPPGTFMLTGKPKTRKSWFALNCSYAVAAGGRALGHFPVRQGEVLYLDLEMGDARIHKRLHAVFPSDPPPKGVTFATTWPKVDAGFEDWLDSYLHAHPYTRLIVVDTLVAIRPRRHRYEDPFEADKAFTQGLSDFCHGRGITLLLLHHSRKAVSVEAIDDGSGTLGLSGGCDNYASLRLDPENRRAGVLALAGRDIERDDDVNLTWDTQLIQWTYQEDRPTPLTPERRKVLTLLQERPGLSGREVALILERPEPGTRRLLSDMLRDSLLTKDQGCWFVRDAT